MSPSNSTDGENPSPSSLAQRKATQHAAAKNWATSSSNTLLFLVAFRLLNASSIKTFFQPDEYFQSLEPAWRMAFGANSGAWITWEWKHHLRSSIHPALFAGVYYVVSYAANIAELSPHVRGELLIVAPKLLQALIAACGDYFTLKLAETVYGPKSHPAQVALGLTVCNPWQWFCSTRTLSNCLETTLTITALALWPWEWLLDGTKHLRLSTYSAGKTRDIVGLRIASEEAHQQGIPQELISLTLAAMACILRPTNVLIWLSLTGFAFLRASKRTRTILFYEALLCGSVVLILSSFIDRLYYQTWTFPPLRFLYFNLAQSLAILYGKNDWHYYLTQGFPLLLTTALPFAIVGYWQALPPPSETESGGALQSKKLITFQLAFTTLFATAVLSLISHKEVRFIYPLLPILHVLAAKPVSQFFLMRTTPSTKPPSNSRFQLKRTPLLATIILINVVIAWYTTTTHQRGVISALDHLRHKYTQSHLSQQQKMTIGFLMPCHSTPWRSHLIHAEIHAWALSCDPPVNLSPSERKTYVDEADRFYSNPSTFLREEMLPPTHSSQTRSNQATGGGFAHYIDRDSTSDETGEIEKKKQWPEYLIFFAQLEETLALLLQGSGYREEWRGFNSHWHDDWRRRGDVVVWRLERAKRVA